MVGIKDQRYGEVVGCFLKAVGVSPRPSDQGVRQWVASVLGQHKSPQHVFWIGDPGMGGDFPKTGSGKHQKHIMRELGERLVKKTMTRASL